MNLADRPQPDLIADSWGAERRFMCDLFTGFIKAFMGLSKIIMSRKDTESPVPYQQLPLVIWSLATIRDWVSSILCDIRCSKLLPDSIYLRLKVFTQWIRVPPIPLATPLTPKPHPLKDTGKNIKFLIKKYLSFSDCPCGLHTITNAQRDECKLIHKQITLISSFFFYWIKSSVIIVS